MSQINRPELILSLRMIIIFIVGCTCQREAEVIELCTNTRLIHSNLLDSRIPAPLSNEC